MSLTPGPWHVGGGNLASWHEARIIRGPKGEYIARANMSREDAARIVQCVNAHDELEARQKVAVDLLREVVGPLEVSAAVIESEDGGNAIETLLANVKRCVEQFDRAAIAKATGST